MVIGNPKGCPELNCHLVLMVCMYPSMYVMHMERSNINLTHGPLFICLLCRGTAGGS